MAKAPAYGAGDSRFESWRVQNLFEHIREKYLYIFNFFTVRSLLRHPNQKRGSPFVSNRSIT